MFPSLVLTELVTSDGSSHLGYENSVTRVLQECYKSVTGVLQECCKSVTRVLQECYRSIARVLQECYKSITVTRMLQVIEWLAKSL